MACEVLKDSIVRRASRPVAFFESWDSEHGWHWLNEKYPRLAGTGFSQWRWIVPELLGWQGRAIYLDADQMVLDDVAQLWDALDDDHDLAAVIGAEGTFHGKKTDPKAVETSVMVMNLARCRWDLADLCRKVEERTLADEFPDSHGRERSTRDYSALMQARWLPLERIQPLPKEWNHFSLCDGRTKLCHFSHVATQPYTNFDSPVGHVFRSGLLDLVRDRPAFVDVLEAEVVRGHLHLGWLNLAQEAT